MSGGDEQRRRLERDARYEAGLANLLVCLRDGHAASPYDAMAYMDIEGNQVAVRLGLCPRCGLCYWLRDRSAEERARAVAQARNAAGTENRERERVIQENVRAGGGSYRPFGQ